MAQEEARRDVVERIGGEPGEDVDGEARSVEDATGGNSQILSSARREGGDDPAECGERCDGCGDAPSGEEHSAGDVSLVPGEGDDGESGGPKEVDPAKGDALEGAPKSRVVVRMTDSKGQVDREVIRRVVAHVAQTCHRRALRRAPAVVGRFKLKFRLNGDYKGPKSLLIDGRESDPQLASCLRREMDRTHWPTGRLCGVGLYEATVDFSVVDAS